MMTTAWKQATLLFRLLVSFCYSLSEMDAKGSGILSKGLCVYRLHGGDDGPILDHDPAHRYPQLLNGPT